MVDGTELRLVEATFELDSAVEKAMKARLLTLKQCGEPKVMKYQGETVGQFYSCSDSKGYVCIYNYGKRIYEISSRYSATVDIFMKNLLPIACHFGYVDECVSMYY